MPPERTSNEELVRRHFRTINERDREGFTGLHAEDIVVHSGETDVHGLEEVLEYSWAQIDAFPDLTESVEAAVAEGDLVAVRVRVTGTHEGELFGIEPTGEAIDVASMALFRIEDGTIVEMWNHPDRFGILDQLGVLDVQTG